MSSTENKLLTPKSKAMQQIATSASLCAELDTPNREKAIAFMKALHQQKEQPGKTDSLYDIGNTLHCFTVGLQEDDESSFFLDDDGGFDYDDSLTIEAPLAELQDQSDESDDDKKAETDDDSDLEKTATHQDSVDSYTDDEPEEKEPKEKKAPTIRTQVRRRSSKKVTDIVAGFPGENSRENANVKIYDKKTFFKASPVEQTKTDKRKKQQRFNYKICIHGQFSVRKNQNNQTPDESSINSSKL